MNSRLLKTTQLAGVHFVYQSLEEANEHAINENMFELLPTGKKIFYVYETHKGIDLKHFYFSKSCVVKKDWKNAVAGDWCLLDDGGVVLCLDRFTLLNKRYPKHSQPIVKFINGSFNANERYDYKSTSKFKDRSDVFSTSVKGQFTFKPKHANFVTHFIILLTLNSDIEEAKIDAWRTCVGFDEESLQKNTNYRIKMLSFINVVLRSDKSMEIIYKMTNGNSKLKDLLANNNLTRKDMIEKVATDIKTLNPNSKNYVGVMNLVENWNDKADLEEKNANKEENKPTLLPLPSAETADFEDITGQKELTNGNVKPLVDELAPKQGVKVGLKFG